VDARTGYVEAAVKITAGEVVNAKHQAAKSANGHRAALSNGFPRAENHAGQDISQIPVFEENLPIGTIYETRS